MALIEIKNLSKKYKESSFFALDNINLSLHGGQIVGLIGPNGSGKTTLIKILNGLLKNYEGNVLIDGHAVDPYTKSIVSYLPDNTYLPLEIKVADAIALFADMYRDFNKDTMHSLLNRMKIDTNVKIKALSKGNKEKMQLALVLSRKAMIYILDEPIGGVDPAAREFIIETILGNYAKDALVIVSTHLLEDIEPILDRVIFLKNGNIVVNEITSTLKEIHQKSINELFKEVFKC